MFDLDHVAFLEILGKAAWTDGVGQAGIDSLAQRLNDHIRMEEAVLFPAAVKALAATVSARTVGKS